MRKLVAQRWALILLLISRLIVGELGHAVPMASMSTIGSETVLAEQDSVACPEHESAAPNADSHHSNASTEGAEHNCCKTGECECPCLHVPCAALDPSVAGPAHLEPHRIPDGICGLMLQRLSGLFRPPA